MDQVRGVMLGPGEGQRLLGGGMDATIKVTLGHPALASMFELRVPPGLDVGAHVHTHNLRSDYLPTYLREDQARLFAQQP